MVADEPFIGFGMLEVVFETGQVPVADVTEGCPLGRPAAVEVMARSQGLGGEDTIPCD